jgi:hypothetical protein
VCNFEGEDPSGIISEWDNGTRHSRAYSDMNSAEATLAGEWFQVLYPDEPLYSRRSSANSTAVVYHDRRRCSSYEGGFICFYYRVKASVSPSGEFTPVLAKSPKSFQPCGVHCRLAWIASGMRRNFEALGQPSLSTAAEPCVVPPFASLLINPFRTTKLPARGLCFHWAPC